MYISPLIWAQERARITPEQRAKDDALMTSLFGTPQRAEAAALKKEAAPVEDAAF